MFDATAVSSLYLDFVAPPPPLQGCVSVESGEKEWLDGDEVKLPVTAEE